MAAIAQGDRTKRHAGRRHLQPGHLSAGPSLHPCDRGRRRVPRDDGDACSGTRRFRDRRSHRRPGARAGRRPDRFAEHFLATHRDATNAAAVRHRLPLIGNVVPRAGGLMSYWPDSVDGYSQAASYIDRILRGASPADLPVQEPTKYSLIINLKTAKALGLTVPPGMLDLADEVIE